MEKINWDFFEKLESANLLEVEINKENFLELDFTLENKKLSELDLVDTELFNQFVFEAIKTAGKIGGIGGYLEDRFIYQRSNHFGLAASRSIHLGIDLWLEANSPVYAPLDGKVHSFKDNNNFGDYGPTIILEHEFENTVFYTLYGHLKKSDLNHLTIGQKINIGEKFCHLGEIEENGNWPPHLHFQLITDMKNLKGDYPGVCYPNEIEEYAYLCPNPMLLIKTFK